MKKFKLLIAAVFVMGLGYSIWAGENVNVPVSVNSNPLDSATYGGVDVATASFTAGIATACVPISTGAFLQAPGVLDGVIISSDNTQAFVDFFDTNTCGNLPNDAQFMFRVYTDTTNANGNGGLTGTYRFFQYPPRFLNGLCFKPSSAALNKVTVLYYRRRK